MGILDSNVFKPSSKDINLSGAATTRYTYLGGGQGLIDVSKYSVMCFQVRTITSGVEFRVYGGVTGHFRTLLSHNSFTGDLLEKINAADTYWVDVSHVKTIGFYLTNGVEDGELNIDILLKNTPVQFELKPVQSIYAHTYSLASGDTSRYISLTDYSIMLSQYKFIVVYARFMNSSNTNISKNSIALYIDNLFSDEKSTIAEEQCSITNSSFIASEWIPLRSKKIACRFTYTGASAEGDKLYLEIMGIR